MEFYSGFLGFTIDWEHRFGENFPLYAQIARGSLDLASERASRRCDAGLQGLHPDDRHPRISSRIVGQALCLCQAWPRGSVLGRAHRGSGRSLRQQASVQRIFEETSDRDGHRPDQGRHAGDGTACLFAQCRGGADAAPGGRRRSRIISISKPRSAAMPPRGGEDERCEAVYASVARLLNAAPDEIALVENATVAWQMAFYSLPFAPGDRILTAEAEYAANYVAFLQVAQAHRRCDRCRAERCDGRTRRRGARTHDRRARQAHRHHLGPDQWRARQSGRRRRAHRPGAWHSLSARCLPGSRPDAGRCRSTRLRHAVGDRAQIPARAARHRLSLCAQGICSTGSNRR